MFKQIAVQFKIYPIIRYMSSKIYPIPNISEKDRHIIQQAIDQHKSSSVFNAESTKESELKNVLLREPYFYTQLNSTQLASICVFCNTKTIQEGHVVSSDHFTCLYNIRPVFPGHVLVLPKSHVTRVEDLNVEHATDYLIFTQNIIRALKQAYNTDSINMIIQEGPFSGQSIQHLHVHYLPRSKNDLPMIVKAVEGNNHKEENQEQEWMDYFRKQEHTARLLTVDEMQLEAEKIRRAFYCT